MQAALLHCDPAEARARAEAAGDARNVVSGGPPRRGLDVDRDPRTPDAAHLEDIVAAVAHWLGLLGDPDALPVRRARALGMLADPQAVLDFRDRLTEHLADRSRSRGGTEDAMGHGPSAAVPGVGRFGTDGPSTSTCTPPATGPSDRVARLKAPVVASRCRWRRSSSGCGTSPPARSSSSTSVIDTTEHIAVDAYEAPPRLARQIEERDLVCGFPWCGRRGLHRDLDHIVEYARPRRGRTAGSDNSHNMARLCRFHHRVKTHTAWTYWREPDDSLTWRSPTRQQFRVDSTGTTQL